MNNTTRMPHFTRRKFLKQSGVASAAILSGCVVGRQGSHSRSNVVQTVLGPVPAKDLGFTLCHEHVMCDFIGAEQTGRHRWKVDEVVQTILPHLRQLKLRGVTGFVDCTPAYIGRDPRVLKALASETGMHILTNTGYYGGAGDKFVPKHAYTETAAQLSDRWVREWEQGIEDTKVRPGFIKTGVDEAQGTPPHLSEIDAKLIRSSALASRRTGLPVTCHTGGGPAGLAATQLFIEQGADPEKFIVAHSDGHGIEFNKRIASLGAWVSFDAVSRKPVEEHLKLVTAMMEQHSSRLLLSHDNGWYWVGQAKGGEVRDYNYIADVFLPALRKSGASEALITQLTIGNPARAFGLRSA